MTTNDESRRDPTPAGKEGQMSEKMETVRAWFAPGVVIALALYGVGGVSKINSIDNVAQGAKDSVVEMKTRVQALETNGVTATAKMAVVESRLDSALKLLERIDARMEARSGREGK